MKKKLLLSFVLTLAAVQPINLSAMNRQNLPLIFGTAIAGGSFLLGYLLTDNNNEEKENNQEILTLNSLADYAVQNSKNLNRFSAQSFYNKIIKNNFIYSYDAPAQYIINFSVSREGNTCYSYTNYKLQEQSIDFKRTIKSICVLPEKNVSEATNILFRTLASQEINIALDKNDFKKVAQLISQGAYVDRLARKKIFELENEHFINKIEPIINDNEGSSTSFHITNFSFTLSKEIITSKRKASKIEQILVALCNLQTTPQQVIGAMTEIVNNRSTYDCSTNEYLIKKCNIGIKQTLHWNQNEEKIKRINQDYNKKLIEQYTKMINAHFKQCRN